MTRIVLVFVSLFSAVASAQTATPLFELPAPTGKLPIGTTRWVVTDASRDEAFAPGRKRDVEVIAWYPRAGDAGESLAPYIRDGMEEVLAFARLTKSGDAWNGLAAVKTHAVLDAAPAASPARFPVILFQHGYTGLPSSYTALMEDLASHGWAVLNVVHPYEAGGAKLADGTVVTMLDGQGALRSGITDVLNEWGAEDSTMQKVTSASTAAEKETLMRGYLDTLDKCVEVVIRWTLDAKYVLDHLPKGGAPGRVASRLDLTRLGAAARSVSRIAAARRRSTSTASRSTGR